MALKSSVFRITLQVADLDRHVYQDFPLTIARHPSETEARMMLRVLAFALHADERLEFGRGISTEDDPDLSVQTLDGQIDTWIALGAPDPERLRKACGRSEHVVLYAYGDKALPVWWRKNEPVLNRLDKLHIAQISDQDMHALASACQTGMELQCTISEGEALLSWSDGSMTVAPTVIKNTGDQ
ncbi:YaeQ [Luminiphilus syltensis NOR5-1B]|uniref:YaeQ n=1 Tax=Luminiphilus syltensis NOR5-1B TaxID=565045 RepID=B8KTY4_9GAMM|nr:YaeQ family protein [Luminiphilus syltensis]EED34482.1 YaeQ [Luminiphilus syltensis NOR5-1B]